MDAHLVSQSQKFIYAHTEDEARAAYYWALVQAENLPEILEKVFEEVRKAGLEEGKDEMRSELRKLLRLQGSR